MNDYSSSPSFEVVEKVKVNHGLFVSTCQVAETFIHQLVPSQTVKVHLNPVFANNFLVDKKAETLTSSQSSSEGSLFIQATNKIVKQWWKIASTIVCSLALVLMHCICFGEHLDQNEKLKEWNNGIKGCNRSSEVKVSVVNIRGGGNKNGIVVFLKKIGIFLTVSLARCTMWANHNIITS